MPGERASSVTSSETVVTYHDGTCAMCSRRLRRREDVQSVHMHVFGPAGTVTLRCWLCRNCRPAPETVGETSGLLAERVLGWYRSNPSLWPTLHRPTSN